MIESSYKLSALRKKKSNLQVRNKVLQVIFL